MYLEPCSEHINTIQGSNRMVCLRHCGVTLKVKSEVLVIKHQGVQINYLFPSVLAKHLDNVTVCLHFGRSRHCES